MPARARTGATSTSHANTPSALDLAGHQTSGCEVSCCFFLFGTRASLRRRVSGLALPSHSNSVALMTRRMTAFFNPLHVGLDFSIVDAAAAAPRWSASFQRRRIGRVRPWSLRRRWTGDSSVVELEYELHHHTHAPPTKHGRILPRLKLPADRRTSTQDQRLIWIDSQSSSSGGVAR
jgi:hypothetical protein